MNVVPKPPDAGYETDFVAWTTAQAAHLRAGRFSALDVDNLVEEIESLGRSDQDAVASQLERLFLHLLKWRFQPEKRSRSWLVSIADARSRIERKVEASPSLGRFLADAAATEYRRARKAAAVQTGLPLETFPEVAPFDLAQALDEAFLPGDEGPGGERR